MDSLILISAAGLMVVSAGAIWVVYVLMQQVDALTTRLDDLTSDFENDVGGLRADFDELWDSHNYHCRQINKLVDVAEAARLKKQNEYLQGLVDSGKAYKQQIAENKKAIKDLMP